MTNVAFGLYQGRAEAHYDEYLQYQANVDSLEKAAELKVRREQKDDVTDIAIRELVALRLAKYHAYRRLCAIRDMHMEVAHLNATMALMYKD